MKSQLAFITSRGQQRPPTRRFSLIALHLLLLLGLIVPWSAQASPTSQITPGGSDTDMATNGAAITAGLVSTVGDFAQAGNQRSLLPKGQPPSLLARQDYQKVYDQANALLTTGVTFRRTKLQLPPSCKTVDECRLNYEDFNNGELFSPSAPTMKVWMRGATVLATTLVPGRSPQHRSAANWCGRARCSAFWPWPSRAILPC